MNCGPVSVTFLVSLSLFSSPGIAAVIWHVDGSVPESGDGASWQTAITTIQEAIDVAGTEDTVIVAQGVYLENIHFKGKNLVVRSNNPLDPDIVAATIIDGNQIGPVVSFEGTEDESCALLGFTIRNGKADQGGGICGGGALYDCDGVIDSNTISGN